MTIDSVYAPPNAPPIDHDWLRLFARGTAHRTTRLRVRPGVARILRALGVIAASTAVSVVDAAEPPTTVSALAAADTQTIVELRQYTLHPGQRDTLIELFEAQFIETQEDSGMRVLAQFRDLDHPDRFVWLRSFGDMPSRKAALERFYGGPVWKTHREAANATMIDSDNVLLLRPAAATSRFDLSGRTRPSQEAADTPNGLVVATIHYLQEGAAPSLLTLLRESIEPQWRRAGAKPLAAFVTETAQNTFPRLPVRSDVQVLVTFVAFDDEAQQRDFAASSLARDIDAIISPYRVRASETLRLQPTRRSLLR